jgi:2-haloacid dehalogenase
MPDQQVIAFDLFGTLLDLSVLDGFFREEFGGSRLRQEWFGEVQKLAFSITAMGEYENFSDITDAALRVVEERHRQKLSGMRRKRILRGLHELPPFPDVKSALRRLQSSGFRLIVLTNSGQKAAKQAIESCGLAGLFEEVLSAERVKRLKPAAEPYRMAAKKLGVKPRKLLLVAAHSWDIGGAVRAGCRACFVRRPEQVLDELTPEPDLVVSDLRDLAAQLVQTQQAA